MLFIKYIGDFGDPMKCVDARKKERKTIVALVASGNRRFVCPDISSKMGTQILPSENHRHVLA